MHLACQTKCSGREGRDFLPKIAMNPRKKDFQSLTECFRIRLQTHYVRVGFTRGQQGEAGLVGLGKIAEHTRQHGQKDSRDSFELAIFSLADQ